MKTKITLLILSIFTLTLFSQTKIDYSLDEFWNGTSWENRFKTEYQYNTNNKLSVSTSLIWHFSGSGWVNDYKGIYTYDTNNNIMQVNYQYWDDNINQWIDASKQERTYNTNNNPTQFLDFDWDGNQWVNAYKTTISYISINKINESYSFSWNGSQWVNDYKSTYNYNTNNKFDNIVGEDWDGSQWVVSSKDTYSYFGNGKISEILYQEQAGSQWQDVEKQEYQIDSNFNRLYEIDYDLLSGTNPYGKYEYTYDTSVLMSTIIHPFNDTLLYNLGFEDNPFINKVLQEIQSSYNGVWEQDNRKTYHYTNTASTSDNSVNISIYPNPTSNILTINLDNLFNIKQINIYDTLGKIIFTTTKNTMNIQALENGIYFLELETISGNIAKKTIIKK